MENEENSEHQVDIFDLLPDALVFEIFNRLEDAKSLSACAVLCKRFGDLVAQTHKVSLQITPRRRHLNLNNTSKGLITRFIFKPLHAFLQRVVSRKPKACCVDKEGECNTLFRLPNDLLKSFKQIRSLSVKLPGHEGADMENDSSGALLKWKAEFGKQLESCVILGATGFHISETKLENDDAVMHANLTNKQFKKRVVWLISCLIASSARHHMLKQIIMSNGTMREVTISDGSKQGMIHMTERQVVELRNEDMIEHLDDRTKVPAVRIKMWYMPVLELPGSGGVMKGATLAVVRPTVSPVDKDDDVALAVGAFGEDFIAEAVRKLMDTKKSYTLEMTSF